jgi:hypothetical protein
MEDGGGRERRRPQRCSEHDAVADGVDEQQRRPDRHGSSTWRRMLAAVARLLDAGKV